MKQAVEEFVYGDLKVSILPCLKDNYIFILEHSQLRGAVVVDPPESQGVMAFLRERSLSLAEIWITHHHHDHVGGVLALQLEESCGVRGSAQIPGRIPGLSIPVQGGSSWSLGSFMVEVLFLPGHTLDHIAYWVHSQDYSLLFSGDVLFGFGCGRVFEGTYEQMFASLEIIMSLPETTQIFCSHEYTENNLRFTESIMQNESITQRAQRVRQRRREDKPTVPLSLHEEKLTNLFLLTRNHQKPIAEFRRLRDERNSF